jgi:hypothetical protein
MKNLGIILTVAGAIAGIWGFSYTSSHQGEAFGAMFGVTSETYKMANILGPLGVLAAIIGIVMLIVVASKDKKSV